MTQGWLIAVFVYCAVVIIGYAVIMAWLAGLSARGVFIELWQALFKRKK